ncbi:MAG: LamB/YcsF family protein [Chloroflexota bacterium]|nr:LamB/YcsF family protein [Chloroflexota bacterium]
MRIDLNCDCGESYGRWQLGDDAALLPHVTSANIACGGHAGDPNVMRQTVRLARERGVAVGAHPGYPDLAGFGRRVLPLATDEIFACVLAQIGALYAIARAERVELTHVKPHGALYTHAATTPAVADAIARAVAAFSRELIFVGLAGSAMVDAASEAGLRVAREAFADRAYEWDGSLRARDLPGAVIEQEARALAQAIMIVAEGVVVAVDGSTVPLVADTICLHGDTRGAAERAAYLRAGLRRAGIEVVPLTEIVYGI